MGKRLASDYVNLKDPNLYDIENHLRNRIYNEYKNINITTKTESDLIMMGRYNKDRIELHLERKPHRPMDVQIYAKYIKNNQAGSNSSGTIILVILGGIFLLSAISGILTLPLFFILAIIGGLVFLEDFTSSSSRSSSESKMLLGQNPSGRKLTDIERFVEMIKLALLEMKNHEVGQVRKCWNCFETIEPFQNFCNECGKYQK